MSVGQSTQLWPDTANVPEYTRPATWEDLKTLAQLLNEAQVEYAKSGQAWRVKHVGLLSLARTNE